MLFVQGKGGGFTLKLFPGFYPAFKFFQVGTNKNTTDSTLLKWGIKRVAVFS